VHTAILGISAYYHDSAAAIIVNGKIIAAAQEERFTRKKHDAGFPLNAVRFVLQQAGLELNDLTAIAFYDKPLLKFERLLETYHAFAPAGVLSFVSAIPVWIKEKLFMKKLLRKQLKQLGNADIPLLFPAHHLSHAASAYYPSPFNEAAILTIDGVGEWATTTISHGQGKDIRILKELRFPHSLGLLYSAFTYYLGFKVNSGEYKLMGLAPYGHAGAQQTLGFEQKILNELIDVREDGSFILNMKYFRFATRLTMTDDKRWEKLFGFARRLPESEITQHHMNLALAIQRVTEYIVIALARTAQKLTNCKNLVMAGGVALNCIANSKVRQTMLFDEVWIQPAAGDAGGALGAAFAAHHIVYGEERRYMGAGDAMQGAYLGPEYHDQDILGLIYKYDATYTHFENFEDLTKGLSKIIADGKVVGWFQGRMEFGPRALGNRSIIADPRNPEMQKRINLKIKGREEFRPFAPSVLLEDVEQYFKTTQPSPYMLFIEALKDELRYPEPPGYDQLHIYGRLYHQRSGFNAITHVDYSARIQTVSRETNPKFWQLINAFKTLTGCGMLVNTSFNVRGEPIVCSLQDAYLGFMCTDMDYLVLGNYLFDKRLQKYTPTKALQNNFAPD
jgi:carbamoyltransferase